LACSLNGFGDVFTIKDLVVKKWSISGIPVLKLENSEPTKKFSKIPLGLLKEDKPSF